MKHLNYILMVCLAIYLITACGPNSEVKKDEVYEESLSTESPSTKDSLAKGEVDSQANQTDHIEEDEVSSTDVDKTLSSTQIETNQKKVKTKPTLSMPINRKVGVKLKTQKDFDLMGFAAEEVIILKKEDCEGENCGTKIQLQSYNSEKIIVAVVEIKWKDSSGKKSELREYKLKPESILDIGCSYSCNEDDIKFSWKIVSAKYD